MEKWMVKAKNVKYVSKPHHLFISVGGLYPFAARVIKTIGRQIVRVLPGFEVDFQYSDNTATPALSPSICKSHLGIQRSSFRQPSC